MQIAGIIHANELRNWHGVCGQAIVEKSDPRFQTNFAAARLKRAQYRRISMQAATTTFDEEKIDRDLERLVHEIGKVIEKARPEKRAELGQMASDLMQEEMMRAQVRFDDSRVGARRPLNLLALGAFLGILGAGLAVLMPQIGFILLGGGLVTLSLGAIHRMATKH